MARSEELKKSIKKLKSKPSFKGEAFLSQLLQASEFFLFSFSRIPRSLLRGWKTPPITVNDNISSQFPFLIVNSCSN
jgi:hypothetical protein